MLRTCSEPLIGHLWYFDTDSLQRTAAHMRQWYWVTLDHVGSIFVASGIYGELPSDWRPGNCADFANLSWNPKFYGDMMVDFLAYFLILQQTYHVMSRPKQWWEIPLHLDGGPVALRSACSERCAFQGCHKATKAIPPTKKSKQFLMMVEIAFFFSGSTQLHYLHVKLWSKKVRVK